MSTNHKLSKIIKVLHSGKEFYHEASSQVANPVLKTTFLHMANIRSQAIRKLQPQVMMEIGEAENGSSLVIGLRQQYTKALSKVKNNSEFIYTDQLDAVEDRTLDVMLDVLSEDLSIHTRTVLTETLIDLKKCQDKVLRHQTIAA